MINTANLNYFDDLKKKPEGFHLFWWAESSGFRFFMQITPSFYVKFYNNVSFD